MDTFKALTSRTTIHRFSEEPVDDAIVERALEAAVAAPNHKLTNPWRFTRIGDETQASITELYLDLKRESKGELSDHQVREYRQKIGGPPVVIAVSQVLDDDPFRRKEDYAAVACAIQNLMLSMFNDGIHTKWSTGSVTRHDETYRMLGIDPDRQEIVGFVFAGRPREDHRDTQKPGRKPLSEVVRKVP
jgi:nitroreductase